MTKCFDFMECTGPERCAREGVCISDEIDEGRWPRPAALDTRTEVVWLNQACSAALERSRGGLFAGHAA